MIVREPAFSAAAILTLALGVGANVAVFAVVESVLLRPLPYADADELLILNHRDRRTGITKEFIAIGDYVDLAARQTTLEHSSPTAPGRPRFMATANRCASSALSATPGLFETLRVSPALGRAVDRRRCAPGRRAGRHPRLRGLAGATFGSRPRHHRSQPSRRNRATADRRHRAVRLPLSADARSEPASSSRCMCLTAAPAERKSGWVFAVGRLKPGRPSNQARREPRRASPARSNSEHPSQNQGSEYLPVSLRDALVGDTRRPLILMFAAVAGRPPGRLRKRRQPPARRARSDAREKWPCGVALGAGRGAACRTAAHRELGARARRGRSRRCRSPTGERRRWSHSCRGRSRFPDCATSGSTGPSWHSRSGVTVADGARLRPGRPPWLPGPRSLGALGTRGEAGAGRAARRGRLGARRRRSRARHRSPRRRRPHPPQLCPAARRRSRASASITC